MAAKKRAHPAPSDDALTAHSWSHLMELLYDVPKDRHGRHRSDCVFRGLADESWDLKTSLNRLGNHCAEVERPLLRAFRKYAEPGTIPTDTLWFRISVAQHHGLPTRVLDWTVSPKVALHFATAEEDHYNKDGAIWCVDIIQAREFLPKSLRDILRRERAFLFSVEMLEEIKNLSEFDALATHSGVFPLFFEPPSLDHRIVNQGAILSMLPGARMVMSDFLKAHPELGRKILIPKELKWEIRDKLDQDNVTERMLFPGLDGLCRWLQRYYGPGAGISDAASPTINSHP